jgi:hypothetical protein
MDLHPCESCRRHIDRRDAVCPFCDAATGNTRPRSSLGAVGRLSRAAIFAGAAACGSTPTQTNHAPPPPPPPPDPVLVQQFATAPPPAEGKGSIRGFVRRDGQPLVGVAVHARREDGTTVDATTGSHGEYTFVDVAPGQWSLSLDHYVYDPYAGSRRPQEGPMMMPDDVVTLDPGENERHDVSFSSPSPPAPDTGPCCKPYGAPPARRRVV